MSDSVVTPVAKKPRRTLTRAVIRFAGDSGDGMNPGKLLPSHPACGEGFRPAGRPLPAGTWI